MRADLKTPTLFLAALFACLLLSAPVLAQTLTVTTDMDFYGPGERIAVSGTAIPNADVTVQLFNPNNELVAMDYAKSGADGKYSMTFVVPAQLPMGKWILGTYTVRAYAAGAEAKKAITIGLKVVVVGKVVDAKGAPIAGATVTVGPASATTGADGAFEVSLTAEGTYTIRVEKAGYYTYTRDVTVKTGVNDVGTIALASYEDKIRELESAIAAVRKDYEDRIKELESAIAALNTIVDKLSSTLDAVKKDLESAKRDIDNLRGTVAIATDLKKSVEALTSTVDGLKKSVDALQPIATQLPILYALALIGIIIAIVAIVQVYRKIAK